MRDAAVACCSPMPPCRSSKQPAALQRSAVAPSVCTETVAALDRARRGINAARINWKSFLARETTDGSPQGLDAYCADVCTAVRIAAEAGQRFLASIQPARSSQNISPQAHMGINSPLGKAWKRADAVPVRVLV